MGALGCLMPFVLMVAGAALGAMLEGRNGGYVGLAAGLALGVVVMLAMLWALGRLRDRA